MASHFQEDLHSSDSEDNDYVPEREVTSDDDDDEKPFVPDEIKTKRKGKLKMNRKVLDAEGERNRTFEESPSTEANVDEKQRANDLFKSFLDEVEAEMKVKKPSFKITEKDCKYDSPEESASDACMKSNESTPKQSSCELFEFANETVAVSLENGTKIVSTEKSTDSTVEMNVPNKPTDQPPVVKRKGLDAVLGTIMNKKSKLTVLQKTSLDWNTYKLEQGISEELQNYNKGRGGFIDRQRFLQKSDVRSYEIERDLRMSKHRKNC